MFKVRALREEEEDLFCTLSAGLPAPLSCTARLAWPSVFAPGVLGVFVEDPKEAKAPEPSPKAEDAPAVGDAIAPLPPGVSELKGLGLPCEEESPPDRLDDEKLRGESVFKVSLGLLFEVASVSFPELPSFSLFYLGAVQHTLTAAARDCPFTRTQIRLVLVKDWTRQFR